MKKDALHATEVLQYIVKPKVNLMVLSFTLSCVEGF